MSPASHMVGRLRELYGVVLGRVRFINQRAMYPSVGGQGMALRCVVEPLEPRLLLSTAPTVLSMNRESPSGTTAEGSSVTYAVTFSEPVTGVTPDDFQLAFTGATTASSTLTVSPTSGYNSAYHVTVNSITGKGTLGLTLVDNGSIVDSPGHHLFVGGTFQSPQVYPTPGPQVGCLAWADLNEDGKLDLVAVNVASDGSGGKNLSMLLGNGDGTFQSQQPVAAGSGIEGATMADLNGDGKMDLVTANGSKCVTVLVGNGDGTFKPPQTYATGGTCPESLAAGDFNGDGKLDLVVGDANGTNVHVLLGNGDGTLQAEQDVPAEFGPDSIATADFNGDGRLDIFSLNSYDKNISVLLGNGDGTFQSQKTQGVNGLPASVAAADLNGDGIPDIVEVNNFGSGDGLGGVNVLLGNGDGTFQTQKEFAAGRWPYTVAVADLNGDGKPDLAVPNSMDNTVSVLMGNGDGTFQSQNAFPTGTYPGGVVAADFNGDGKPDLALTSNNGVGVLLNSNTFPGQIYTIDQPAKLSIIQQPSTTRAGYTINGSNGIQVVVQDSGGSGISCDTSSVTLTLNGGTFASGANAVTVAAVNGIATFSNLIINTPGSYTLTATDGALTQAVSQNFNVTVWATKLGFVQQPTHVVAGSTIAPAVVVAIQDNIGNTDPVNNSTITLTLSSGTFAGGGTTVTAAAVNGVATFNNLIIDVAGSYTLTASDGSLTQVTSGSFAIASTVATRLCFNLQPNNTTLGMATAVGVVLEDPFGNTDLTNNSVVTLTLNGGTFATGKNTVTASAISGVATFNNLIINTAGNYTVTASDGTLTSMTSLAFIVGPSFSINRESPTGTIADPGSVTYAVTFGEPVTGVTPADFQLALTGATTANSTVTVSPASGYNSVYHVTVNNITGYGTLGLNLVDNGSILDQAGNHLANASATFQTAQTFATGYGPESVTAADLNGDGKQDLVTANSGDNTASVLLGNGDGTFQAQRVFATGGAPNYVAAADVNGDGKPDLIVANRGSNNVGVLLGNGDGTFQAQQTYATGTWPVEVVAADVNADGKPDLVVDNNGGTVSVLLGNGDGTFQTQKTFAVGSYPQGVSVADLNGDGKLDLAVANQNNVGVLLGNGDGTFQSQKTFSTGMSSQPSSITVADVNCDGNPDLVVCDPVFYTANVLLGLGDGTFRPQKTFAVGSDPLSIAVADINGDGRLDLITSNYQGYTLGVSLGNGDGTFQAQKAFSAGSYPLFVTTADINGDGKPDLLACDWSSRNVEVLLATNSFTGQVYTISQTALTVLSINRESPAGTVVEAGSVTYAVTFSRPVAGVDSTDFQLAFAGGVSASSAVVVSPSSGYNSVYNVTVNNVSGIGTLGLNLVLNGSIHDQAGNPLGNVIFRYPQTYTTGSNTKPDFVVLSDVNGDGKADMVVCNDNTNNVSVLLGNGDGTFQAQRIFSTGYQPFSVAVTDVNGDGKRDLVVGNWGDSTVSVLLGNGDGTFQTQRIFAAGTYVRFVAAADVNGDGKPDIAVANNHGSVSVLLGNGDGTFQTQNTIATGDGTASVAIGDLNGDGKPDLIVANGFDDNVGVLLGNGDGSFQAENTFATGSEPYTDLAVTDVNGDGKLDVIVPNTYANTVSVLLGNGDGTFQTQQTFATGTCPQSVAVADINGDGKADLVVTNMDDNTVGVLLGNGDGTFLSQQTFVVGSTPTYVSVADLNGDGKPDLAVANEGSNYVSVLLGSNIVTGQLYTIEQPVKLAFTQPPTSTPAWSIINGATGVQVAVEDSNGLLLGNDSSVVTLKLSSGTFASGSNTVSVAAVNGVATFSNLIINVQGSYTLTASDGILMGATSGSFTIGAPAATKLSFAQQPTNTGAGVTMAPAVTVAVQDPFGNTSTTNNSTVTLTLSSGTFASGGSTVTVAAVNGIATFSGLVIPAAGNYTLTASDGSLTGATSSSFAIVLPAIVSINRQIPAGATTEATSVTYAVTFNEPVTGLTSANFQLAFTGGASASSTVVISPSGGYNSVYSVTVNNISGKGTLRLNLVSTGSIMDPAGNHLASSNPILQSQQTFITGAAPDSVAAADVNGDGKLDLITANFSDNTVSVLLGNGDGTFPTQRTFATGTAPAGVAVADANGDGKPDLVVANSSDNTVSLLLGNGDGTFQPQNTFATGSSPSSVAASDVNGDGKADLVVTNSLNRTVGVLLGNGDGTFQAQKTSSVGTSPSSVAVSDMNGDGKSDLTVANNRTSGTVSVLLGNGDGTFQAQKTFSVGSDPLSVVATDVNGDGKSDLVVANASSDNVSVLLGNGDGTFQAQKTFSTYSYMQSVAVGDVNGDGKPDLISANSDNNAAGVLLGNGDGTFQTQQTFTAGTGPQAVVLADVNGDSKPDLVVANGAGATVSVLLNNDNFMGQLYTVDQPTHLAFTQPPTSTTAGKIINSPTGVQVAVEDSGGSTVGTDSSSVTLTLSSGTFASGGSTVTVAAVNGIATFNNLVINAPGSYTLTASDGSLTGATSNSFTVSVGAAVKLRFTQQPTNTASGTAISPALIVAVQDAAGNIVTTNSSKVTLMLSSGSFADGNTNVSVAAVNGVATFNNLIINASGTYTLMATDNPLTGAISNSFVIIAAAAAQLSFTQQPTNTLRGAAVSPAVTVAVQDASGNAVVTNSSTVTLTLSSGTFASGGSTATATAAGGVATFNNLIINATGNYTLTASDGSLTGETSGSFAVCPLGDVNLDGAINATDIDQLYAHLGDTTGRYDLNGDGAADQGDVDYLVKTILQTGYADANLDRKVDFTDFQVLLDHWQFKTQGWVGGDWNGDGVTDFQDFQVLLDNWNPNGFGTVGQGDPASMSPAAVSASAGVQVESLTVASPSTGLSATAAAGVSTASTNAPAPLDVSISLLSQGVTPTSVSMHATRLSSGRNAMRQLRHSAVLVQNDNADNVDLLTQLIKPVVA